MKICFVGNLSSSFIQKDYEILGKYSNLNLIKPPKSRIEWMKYPLNVAKKVKACDVVFCWFAGWHSAIPIHYAKKYEKKSIVVVGGYDAAYVPELNYGAFTNIKEKIPAKYVYKNVDKTLVVDNSLKKEVIRNAKVTGEKIDYLPTGYNPEYWKPLGEKKDIVLTVATADRLSRIKLKGLDTFIKAAKYFSNTEFIMIGCKGQVREYLEKKAPRNVRIIGFLSRDKLLKHYQKAKVFCLLSFREGLPNVLCEAMLCECIPVGTNVQGVTSAMGDNGFYVSYGDVNSTVEGIKKALNAPNSIGKKARNRIKKNFPIDKREKKLKEIIEGLVK